MIDKINEPECCLPEGTPVETIEAKPVVTDAQLRSRQAAEEIRIILEAYDSELFPVMMLSPKGVIGVSIDIIPKAKKPVPLSGPTAVPDAEPSVPDAEPCCCDDFEECTGECIGTNEPAVPDSVA